MVTVTLLVEIQVPFEMRHSNTYTPAIIPVTDVVAELAFAKVGLFGPLIIVHVPVPTDGTLPVIIVLVTLQRFCGDPAIDVVGGAEMVTVTVLSEGAQVPLEIVHLNT